MFGQNKFWCGNKYLILVWFSLFNGKLTFVGYLMLNPSLKKDSWKIKGSYIFPKGVSTKANVIARLEFELVHFEAVIQVLRHIISDEVSYLSNIMICASFFR